jgi:hypothetical protein
MHAIARCVRDPAVMMRIGKQAAISDYLMKRGAQHE